MTPERQRRLQGKGGMSITAKEWAEGWRFCCEWDGMLVNCNDTEGEGACCTCKDSPYPPHESSESGVKNT